LGHNLKGRMSAECETFSGTVTLAQPTDVPEGGSPRNQNQDFSVGSTFTRQGEENKFTYLDGSVGPSGGGTAVNSDVKGAVWANPANVLSNTGIYAVAVLTPQLPIASVYAFISTGLPPWERGPAQYWAVVTFTEDVPAFYNGQLYAFSGLTTYTAFNGQTLYAYPPPPTDLPVYNLPMIGPNQVLFNFAETPIPLQPTTADTGNATTSGVTAFTDLLNVTQFGFSIPASSVPQGVVVTIEGFAAVQDCNCSIQLMKDGFPVGDFQTVIMQKTTTGMVFGNANFLFGQSWGYADINDPGFGVSIQVSSENFTYIYIGYVTVQVYFLPTQSNFNYIQTYEDDFGNIYNIALDDSGAFWAEYVSTNPGVLAPLFLGPPPRSFASGFTAQSRQYVAISDLAQGSYPPQQIVGTNAAQQGWHDRVSQVGPGAPPAFTGTLAASGNIAVTGYSYSGGVLTITAANSLTAGEVVTIHAAVGDALRPLNGLQFNVLGTGLSGTQFEIAETVVTGSGSSAATVTSQYSYPIVASPNGITQFPFWNSAQGYQSQLDDILWSAGPGSTNSGNVVTVYYLNAFTNPNAVDANLARAVQQQKFPVYVYVSGTNLPVANGTQLVTGIGIGTPPGGGDERYFFTFNVPSSSYNNLGGGANAQPGSYQLTVATITASLPLPGVEVGDDVTITGAGVSAWDETWPIVNALNSGSYAISQTEMTAGVATYNWALSGATSSPPAPGQLVTVTGTLNGNGVFNVTDAVIATATGSSSGTFTIAGFGAQSYGTQAEVGQATTSGTTFQIDPGPLTLGNSADDPIYGNSGGGFITLVGSSSVVVGTGTRKGTVFFISRNGYWSVPAPWVQFNTDENTNYILVSNIPIGPPNVIARAIAFTEAGGEGQPGASWYFIDVPESFVYNGVTYLSSSTVINDNVTTTAKFTFPDSVLLNAEEIDIQGNNLFSLEEIGDAAWCAQYAGRSIYGRVRTKVQNFLNLSFDGGYNPNPGGNLLPLGWGVDPQYNPADSALTLMASPVFGDALYIQNQVGGTPAILGMITQTAYQDQNNVAILQNSTAYSVRVSCRTPSSATVGSLVIDLTSFNAASGYGQTYGSFTLALSAMTSNFITYSGTLLTLTTLTIPEGLVLRVWASGFAHFADVEIDRIEIYPTIEPTDLTQLTLSYKDDLESFDRATGFIDTTTQNAQPANGGFEMNGLFYVVKESSLGYIADTPNQEPQNWNPFKEVSNVAGACGINAYDVGKKWAVMACQNGLFLFNGGEPIPIHLEIPDWWEAIAWEYGSTICVRNDTALNRMFIAVPMATPNQWCPNFPVNSSPTEPNVVFFLNYDGIGSIEQLMSAESMHVTIMGQLAVHDLRRKWSMWSIPTPYMAICKRNELFSEMLFCNGVQSSKIYHLGSYTLGADDGVPFPSSYCTYGFVDQKKAKENPVFGMHNKRYVYYDFLLSGSGDINAGTLSIEFFQNVLEAPYPFAVPGGITLSDPAANDVEGPLDEFGQRMFVEVATYGVGCYFNLSRMTLVAQADAWAPLRGF
jgi:hypothetical protein